MTLIVGYKRGLALHSCARVQINNELDTRQLDAGQIAYCRDKVREFAPNGIIRARPCAEYNCHGMTFASRRCSVGDLAVPSILHDDQYTKIDRETDVLPGDVVLYWLPPEKGGSVDHSGIVVKRSYNGEVFDPLVFSKWANCAEVIHSLYQSPYSKIFTFHRMGAL